MRVSRKLVPTGKRGEPSSYDRGETISLVSGQKAGEMLLDIEARIGEMLPSNEEIARQRSEQYKGRPLTKQKGLKQRPEGLTVLRAHQARAISKHPEIVERVKAQARENE